MIVAMGIVPVRSNKWAWFGTSAHAKHCVCVSPTMLAKPFQKTHPISVLPEYFFPFNTPDRDVVKRSDSINSCFPWDGLIIRSIFVRSKA